MESIVKRAQWLLKYGAIISAVFTAISVFIDELEKIKQNKENGKD